VRRSPPSRALLIAINAMMREQRRWQRRSSPNPVAARMRVWTWPKEYGGAGLSAIGRAILDEELARARAPAVVNVTAIWWVGQPS
jgi:alkylation response protein AidB-like acyl-CoA dehydrogenase